MKLQVCKICKKEFTAPKIKPVCYKSECRLAYDKERELRNIPNTTTKQGELF